MTRDWFGVRPVSQEEKALRADLEAVVVAADRFRQTTYGVEGHNAAYFVLKESLARPRVQKILKGVKDG